MKCPQCGGCNCFEITADDGTDGDTPEYECFDCGFEFTQEDDEHAMSE